jgi:hypothetical protein
MEGEQENKAAEAVADPAQISETHPLALLERIKALEAKLEEQAKPIAAEAGQDLATELKTKLEDLEALLDKHGIRVHD